MSAWTHAALEWWVHLSWARCALLMMLSFGSAALVYAVHTTKDHP